MKSTETVKKGDKQMKKPYIMLLFWIPVCLLVASAVSADPRMQTNDNFCHFILDPVNTDNEVFVAGCNSEITTVETVPSADLQIKCENAVASGFGEVTKVVPQSAILIPPGKTIRFTSDDSDTPCTMVESNGRAYTSHNWKSTISVESIMNRRGFVRVHYMLICQDGQL
jgi:hypothetical protein